MKRFWHQNSSYCSVLIFFCFFLTASGYLSWLYRLLDFTSAGNADWMSEVIGYLFQACGYMIFGLLYRKYEKWMNHKYVFIGVVVTDFLFICLAVLSGNLVTALIFGYGMNLLHGVLAGFYLTYLTLLVEWNRRGITFGMAYGIASIASWLLSLPVQGKYIQSSSSLVVYALLSLLIIGLLVKKELLLSAQEKKHTEKNLPISFLLLAGITVLMVSLVKNIGFYFPTAEISKGIDLEFSRAFYAVGLILAGLISDLNRKYSGISCVTALIFPFALFFLSKVVGASVFIWIIGYLFTGFFTVFRVLLFSDLAEQKKDFLFIAGFGMMFGRIGDAFGALGGILLRHHIVFLVVLSACLFAVSVFLFLILYQKLYMPSEMKTMSKEEQFDTFIHQYVLSARESEVLVFLVKGLSNGEIAANLFISENTVKFHVHNLLKKTGCKNRVDLVELMKREGI